MQTTTSDRKFGLTVGTAFLLLAGITWWRDHLLLRNIFAGVGGVLILGGAFVPSLLGPVHRGWMGMALAISKVTTPIFMGIFYFVVLMPVGLAMRLAGRNPLTRQHRGPSYWVDRSSEAKTDLQRQF